MIYPLMAGRVSVFLGFGIPSWEHVTGVSRRERRCLKYSQSIINI